MAGRDDRLLWTRYRPCVHGRRRHHPYDGADAEDMRNWFSDKGDVRREALIFKDIIQFVESHGAKSVVMTGRIIGCPHQEDIDYEGEWCPLCDFWKGRDRFTGGLVS